MVNIYNIILFLIASLCTISCIEQVSLDPKERTVVVDCILTNDSIQTVKLSYSSYISEEEYPKVKEAEVKMNFFVDTVVSIWQNHREYIDVEIDTSGSYEFVKIEDGVWQAEFTPIGLAKYTIEINIPEYGLVTASTIFPSKINFDYALDRFAIEGSSLSKSDTPTAKEILTPNAEIDNLVAYTIGSSVRGQDVLLWIYGNDYDPLTNEYKIADYINTSHLGVDNFNRTSITKDDIAEFKWPTNIYDAVLADATDPYYGVDTIYGTSMKLDVSSHHPGCYLFSWSQDYMSDINSVCKTFRIENYFCNRVVLIPWHNGNNYNFHDKYLRINQPYGSVVSYDYFQRVNYLKLDMTRRRDQEFIISVNFKPYKYYVPHPLSHLVFQFVSEDLDKYYKSVIAYNDGETLETTTDLALLWNLDAAVYSNISNGVGIFGAAQIERVLWGLSQHYYESYMASQNGL